MTLSNGQRAEFNVKLTAASEGFFQAGVVLNVIFQKGSLYRKCIKS